MSLTGPLALRAMTRPPDLSGISLSDPTSCRFELGVNADGIVELALPLSSSEPAETLQKLSGVLRAIRFAPAGAKQTAPMLGTATFHWSHVTP